MILRWPLKKPEFSQFLWIRAARLVACGTDYRRNLCAELVFSSRLRAKLLLILQ